MSGERSKERLLSILLSPGSPNVLLQCSNSKRMGGFGFYNELSVDCLRANVSSANGKPTQHFGYNIFKCVAQLGLFDDAVCRVGRLV